jgi:hypothetical protein
MIIGRSGSHWLVKARSLKEAFERWNDLAENGDRELAIRAEYPTRSEIAHCRSMGSEGW